MLYVEAGHKKDMFFVKKKDTKNEDLIVKVFYSKIKAEAYIKENDKIGERK